MGPELGVCRSRQVRVHQVEPGARRRVPPEGIREEAKLPTAAELHLLIANLAEPLSTAVWLVAVTCIRPEELAFKWADLDLEKRQLWIVRAVNRGKLHTPKYQAPTVPFSSLLPM